jgi:hypothetical protein
MQWQWFICTSTISNDIGKDTYNKQTIIGVDNVSSLEPVNIMYEHSTRQQCCVEYPTAINLQLIRWIILNMVYMQLKDNNYI